MKFATPKGTAGYPKLFRADTKFKAHGEYSVSVTFKLDAKVQALMDEITEAFVAEFGAKAVASGKFPWTENEEDGTVTMKFKSRYKPVVTNVDGEELDEDSHIGSGSEVRVAGQARFSEVMGKKYATLGLKQVKVLNIVQYNSDPFGGDDEDDEEEKPRAKVAKTESDKAKPAAKAKAKQVDLDDEDEDSDF